MSDPITLLEGTASLIGILVIIIGGSIKFGRLEQRVAHIDKSVNGVAESENTLREDVVEIRERLASGASRFEAHADRLKRIETKIDEAT